MARIAGLLSSWPASKVHEQLDLMLGRFHIPRAAVSKSYKVATGMGAVYASSQIAPIATRGPLIAVIDGFIFNARDFGSLGRPMAEIFLDAYEVYGFRGALERINGDFAVALYDSVSGLLSLARDRIGIKPLYYTQRNGVFAFASQPRALLEVPGVSRSVNRQFVALFAGSHYRAFDNDPNASPFADILQLPAGQLLEIGDANQLPRLSRYWTLSEQPEFTASEDELAAQYRELLIDAVRLRLDVANSPAFLLSGGMDSSSVLASAVHVSGRKQHAFSSVYDDHTYDESGQIRSMLETGVAQWHPIKIAPDDLFSIVDRMVRVHDEPVATATWLSHYLLCGEAATRGFGTLFGGLGGDELNAGEYEYFFFHFADLRLARDEQRLRHEIECWARHHDHPIYRKNMAVAEDGLARLVDIRVPGLCRPDRARLDRYAAAVNREYFDLHEFAPVMDSPFRSYLKNRTYQDIFRETAPCCLRAEDRQTTAFGLEHFDPFFDHRLVKFMFRVPGNMKIRDGVTKRLLREATKELLPEETRTRIKKTGWNAPAHVWFSGPTLNALRDLVAAQEFRERGIYNIAEVRRVIDEHEAIVQRGAARENHMMFLWQLVNLELWCESLEERTLIPTKKCKYAVETPGSSYYNVREDS